MANTIDEIILELRKSRLRKVMDAAKNLILTCEFIYIACEEYDDGWFDLYSHEPIDKCLSILNQAIESIKPFLTGDDTLFEFRLFCPNGYYTCLCDGSPEEGRSLEMRVGFKTNSSIGRE